MTLPYSAAFGSLITATATNAGKDTSEFSAPVTALPSGKKGDVAPRPNGDGLIQSDDVVQVQRFQIGLDPIVSGSNEFKRADSAPLSVGDGLIQSNDVVQAQRFQIGLDPLQNVGAHSDGESPMSDWAESVSELVGRPQSEAFAKTGMGTSARFPPRRLRIEPTRISSNEVTANILVDATGIEAAYGFTLEYDPRFLARPHVSIGNIGGSMLCNSAARGQVLCSASYFRGDALGSSSDSIGEILAGKNQVLATVTFMPVRGTGVGMRLLGITSADASNDRAESLLISQEHGRR